MSWMLAALVLVAAVVVAGMGWYERQRPTTRVIALVATLAALAALGRVAFAPVQGVKPTTDIVLLSGYALGGAPGFAVGALAALGSNVVFGQGPWTPWQMAGWGLCGMLGAGLARLTGAHAGRWMLAGACALASVAFGALMNVSNWLLVAPEAGWRGLLLAQATSLPFDVAHVVGSVAFALLFGPELARTLARTRQRLDGRFAPALPRDAAPPARATPASTSPGGARLPVRLASPGPGERHGAGQG